MFHAASMKLGLDRAVLAHQRQQETDDSQETKSKSKSEREVQAKEIDELLKKGAYDVFRDDDDTEAKQFLESDIDQLLERSAKKVTYGNANASSMSSGLGSFSKASFVADTGEGGGKDVDLDDPNFWEKAVGLDIPVETPEEIAQMIDDGVKRSRKQVQVFDPYAPFAEAEQKKKDKMEQRLKEEKEEKERLRLLKKKKKKEEKERKKREKEEARGRLFSALSSEKEDEEDDDDKKKIKEGKSKKERRAERRRALRRAENEDPLMERLKQAWEPPQRNRATSAALRFGFARFCKLRNESHLTSLPIQDLEVFFRSYVYQLSLQVAVTLLALLKSQPAVTAKSSGELEIRHLLRQWLGQPGANELEWICASIHSVIEMQLEVESQRRSLRMPLVLSEPTYVAELRQGAALRALRRICVLNRLNAIVEDALDDVFSGKQCINGFQPRVCMLLCLTDILCDLVELGQEEVGKRGCPTKDLSALDTDLKARHVTTEELSLALSSRLGYSYHDARSPCTWWDRSCDIALLVGSFIHGFGNYEAMRNDEDLPFKGNIRQQAIANEACAAAQGCFVAAGKAARKVFDTALGSAKSKAQEEVHAAVAAVYAASKGEGGEDNANACAENNPTSAVPNVPLSNAIDADDTHLVTLSRLSKSMTAAARANSINFLGSEARMELVESNSSATAAVSVKKESDSDSQSQEDRGLPLHKRLPMPDARVLDSLVVRLIGHIEGDTSSEDIGLANGSPALQWEMGKDAAVHEKARSKALEQFLGWSKEQVTNARSDFNGIGFNGAQCAATHRGLDDGSDYSLGAASQGLAQVATGTDAPRYLRTLGVPMNLTRYAASALMYADTAVLQTMLSNEHKRSLVEAGNAVAVEDKGKSVARIDAEPSNKDAKAVASVDSAGISVTTDTQPAEDGTKQQMRENPLSTSTSKSLKDKAQQQAPAPTCPVIATPFRDDSSVRAGLCVAALHFGLPAVGNGDVRVDAALLGELSRQLSSPEFKPPESLFSLDNLMSEAILLSDGANMPPVDAIQQYFESVLLPHCLRLCVMGNGPTTREARGSEGKFETAYGISNYPDCAKSRQSPLPDPCASLGGQSIEAVACAFAILRRARLMRAAQHIVSGGVALTNLVQVLQSSAVRDSMDDLPVWWCPEIHDIALLVQAATRGLFSILTDRKRNGAAGVFAPDMIKQHVQTRYIPEAESKGLFGSASPVEVAAWLEDQMQQFPSANTLERRLALLCSVATSHLGDDINRYDTLPMWDHGAWPRK